MTKKEEQDGPFGGAVFYDPDLISEAEKAKSVAGVVECVRENLAKPKLRAVFNVCLYDGDDGVYASSNIAGFTDADLDILTQYLEALKVEGRAQTDERLKTMGMH